MIEVGDYVRVKTGTKRGEMGRVIKKYCPDAYYLVTVYEITFEDTNTFEYYRKEFKQLSKDEIIVELL